MTGSPRPPEALRETVKRDLAPVQPLLSPPRRSLALAVWVPLALLVVLSTLGLRRDGEVLGWALTWGVGLVDVAAGLVLVALALSSAAPGRGPARTTAFAVLGLSIAALVGGAVATRAASTGLPASPPFGPASVACFSLEFFVGLSALLVVGRLVLKAAPLRAAWTGLLGGTGAGVMAEGIYRLHCRITDLTHVLVWHGAALVALVLLGAAVGTVRDRREERRLLARLSR